MYVDGNRFHILLYFLFAESRDRISGMYLLTTKFSVVHSPLILLSSSTLLMKC